LTGILLRKSAFFEGAFFGFARDEINLIYFTEFHGVFMDLKI